LIITF